MRLTRLFAATVMMLTACAQPQQPNPVEEPLLTNVRTIEVSNGADRPLPTLIYEPAKGNSHPIVVFSHGLTRAPEDYAPLFTAWAQAGYVVAAPRFPKTARGSAKLEDTDLANQPADVSKVLDAMIALNTKQGDPLSGRLDTTKIAAAGHSLGGMTTVGLFTKHRDPRLIAGIMFATNAWLMGTDFTGDPASLLFVHGDGDKVVYTKDGWDVYQKVKWPKAWVELYGGAHVNPFLAPYDPAFPAVSKTTTDFLHWTLRGDQAAKDRLATDVGNNKLENKL